MWPVVVAVIAVIPSARQNHPALGLNALAYCEANAEWDGEWWNGGVDRGPHGSSAPAWHLTQP
jgi:hypothetical protein